MNYSLNLEILGEIVKSMVEAKQENITYIEDYVYALYFLCNAIKKGDIDADEELKELYHKVTQQVSNLDSYVNEMGEFLVRDVFIPYFHPYQQYLKTFEEKYSTKKELTVGLLFDYLLTTDLLIMKPSFINLSIEDKKKKLNQGSNQSLNQLLVRLHVYEKNKKINIVDITGTKGYLSIGWENDNDLQIKYPFVAKKDSKLYILNNKVIFEAVSTKRTFVNYQKLGLQNSTLESYINRIELEDEDMITLGNHIHIYVEIIDTKKAITQKCVQCGKEYLTSSMNEELCFDCRRDILSAIDKDFVRVIKQSKMGVFDAHRNPDLQVKVIEVNKKGRIEYHDKKIEEKPVKKEIKKEEPKKKEPAFLPGDIVAGYKKIKLIGQGGMGQVFLVEERATHQQMAFKRIIPENNIDQNDIDKFIRECYLHIQVKHKNIAEAYKVEPFQKYPYILMKYYKDGTIKDFFINNSNSPKIFELSRDILIQILEGLDYIHHASLDVYYKDKYDEPVHVQGLVHRDIKPDNIFIEYDKWHKPVVKIADFGLAKSYQLAGFSHMTQDRSILGTLEFMCKQQLKSTIKSKPEVDIWAAVASIYYMFTGKFPKPILPQDHPQLKINIIMIEKCTPIRLYNPYVPIEFAKIIDRALDDSDKLYYQEAKELIKDLKKMKL